jgi:hypothetical protein
VGINPFASDRGELKKYKQASDGRDYRMKWDGSTNVPENTRVSEGEKRLVEKKQSSCVFTLSCLLFRGKPIPFSADDRELFNTNWDRERGVLLSSTEEPVGFGETKRLVPKDELCLLVERGEKM